MKKYEKGNQVYTVQEGSELEIQLIADGFEEKKEEKAKESDKDGKESKSGDKTKGSKSRDKSKKDNKKGNQNKKTTKANAAAEKNSKLPLYVGGLVVSIAVAGVGVFMLLKGRKIK